jgi:hypothetical protein
MKTHLIADVLDKQLTDEHGEKAGRVDGIVIELRSDRPPRVVAVEVSPITMLARLSGRLARRYARIDRHFGPGRGAPFRIEWHRITRRAPTLDFNLGLESTPINAVEDWLRVHVVERIPGGRS